MAAILLFLVAVSLQKAVLGAGVTPQNKPNYTNSFLPPSVQIVHYLIDQTEYDINDHQYHVKFDGKTPIDFSTIAGIDKSRNDKETPTQKQLLNLHTLLVHEAKMQKIGKYQGYSDQVLEVLRETSKLTAVEQLEVVLKEALSRNNLKRSDTKHGADKVIKDLENSESDLYETIKDFEPLQYT
ncbi:hypothetical protein L9F63_004110 [Diploptera punctata]|uniref:Uncharacterized protein n=1 Tax=Diploptera punctata TaxID=6984 RepID=A0AAD7ZH70_DIPPU|nr:hypothetical protein L9F63_004110 [Diploptera punctata]